MKKFILFARVYTWLLVIPPVICSAQNLDVYPNYVVIGAFEHKKNAVFFTDDANQHNFPARFEMNPRRNLYYVYVLTTDDREYAFAEALKLRTDTKYFDTWVFAGLLGEAALANASTLDLDFDPATGEQIVSIESQKSTKATDRSDRSTTSANPQNIGSHNSLQKTESGERTLAGTNRGQDPKSNLSGDSANEKRKQVTITKADGTTVIADTQDGSTVTNDPTQRSAYSVDQSKNEATSATDGKARGTSNDRLTTSNKETVAGTNAKNSGTLNNAQNTAPQNESSLGTNNQLAADGQQMRTDTKSNGTETLTEGNTSNNSFTRSTEANDDVASKNQAGVDLGPPPKQVSTEPLSKEEVTGKNFYFYVFRADNHNMVAGEVDAIDFEKARRMATYPANAPVKIIMPSGKSKQISFLCQVFGYRKLQKEFDPANPAEDMYLDDQGNVVVPFDLMRLQKGDIAIMYNVFFFKDAAVMRPESRYEVNNLLELLKENPTYKIKIHGHTNGNAAGKIIYMDKPGNFYSLSSTKQGGGSAKKLSEERALLIREYLISSGISADRMQVEAWGGKKPIHDKHSARAHENVRVEIEILSD